MGKPRLRFSILYKVMLAMMFISLTPLAIFWYISNGTLQKNLKEQVDTALMSTTGIVVSKVNSWTDMNIRFLRQNSLLEDMQSMETFRQKPVVNSIKATYDWTYLVYAIGSDGYKTVRSDDKPIWKEDGTKAHFRGDRAYFKEIMDGRPISQQVLLSRTLKKPALILCNPIKKTEDTILGALCIGTTLTDMSKTVTNIKIGNTGHAILLDNNGKAIAHGHPDQVDKMLQDLSDHPGYVPENRDKIITYEKDGKRMVAYSETTFQGWTVIVEMEYADAFSELIDARKDALVLLAVTLLLVVFAAIFLAGRVTGPIRNLTGAVDKLSLGVEDVDIPEMTRSDELGDMAQSIDRMGQSIRIALSKLKKKRRP